MGLFRKRTPARPEDPDLPLDIDRAARLRALVREVFAEHGREVVVHPGHLEDDQGARFGLWNLAAVCADEPEHEWPTLVGRHVHGLLNPDDLASVPEPELQATTCLRLIEAAQMPQPGWHPTAQRLGDDVLVVLAVDRPGQVAMPPESFWEERGGVEHWRSVGLTNLRSLLDTVDLRHERISPPGGVGAFDVVLGESFFTASLALELPDLVARFSPGHDTAHGVLVAVPFRHQVAWSVVEPGVATAQALENLFGFATAGFSDAAGPVSPHVYWVRDGAWRQLTRIDADGLAVVHLEPEVAADLGIDEVGQ